MNKKSILSFLAVFFLFTGSVNAALFSPDDPGFNIGTSLPQGYEPSGIVWHNRLHSLFLIWDNGYVSQMDATGKIIETSPENKRIPADLEGITVVDEQSPYLYVLKEFPQQILEFDMRSWNVTGRVWNLLNMPGNGKDGAEALEYDPVKRRFYVGSQFDGQIYVYNVDLASPGAVPLERTIATGVPRGLQGLSYSPETRRMYALIGGKIQEYDQSDVVVQRYDAPGSAQEGLTLLPGCPNGFAPMIIAQDNGPVMKYLQYPIQCPAPEEPPWQRVYDAAGLTPYPTTEVRENYHVFDNKWEFSYFRLPAQEAGAWYSIELDARATSVDALYNLAVYVRSAQGRYTKSRVVDDAAWKTYRFYEYIPAGMPTEIRLVSGVRGASPAGVKREHHLRTVTIRKAEEALDPQAVPAVTGIAMTVSRTGASMRVTTSAEAHATLLINGVLMTNTDMTAAKTWNIQGLQCGRQYSYELRLMGDLYSPVFNNAVVVPGVVETARCP